MICAKKLAKMVAKINIKSAAVIPPATVASGDYGPECRGSPSLQRILGRRMGVGSQSRAIMLNSERRGVSTGEIDLIKQLILSSWMATRIGSERHRVFNLQAKQFRFHRTTLCRRRIFGDVIAA
jgi:hypothetical protein